MGGKTSTTTQQVQIPPEVLARYNAVNAQAQSVAANPFQIYSNDPSKFVAQLNQQQLTGIGNVNTAAGAYQPYLGEATDATRSGMASVMPSELEINRYMNPYQKDVIDATMARMRQEQEQAQSGALGTAISSGAFGGDRAGIAAANLAQQQGMATGQTLAGLNAQNYAQALQTAQQQQGLNLGAEQANLARLLSGGQQMAGLGQAAQAMGLQGAEAQINAGTLGQQTEQAGLSALYNQFQQQQAYPFQVAQFLANIAMGTGALSGSTTTTTQPTSFWSDRRLKHDIKRIGKTDEGMPIYTFKYKGDDSEQTHVGFMADEVEKHHPEAVTTEPSGYKSVDYERATKAGGGGVAGPYGSTVGSQPGLGGYVPQAYLPVGDLMVADSAGLDNARMSAAQQLEAAANFGENMIGLKDRFGKGGDFWEIFGKNENSRGGVVGYASGGPAYLEGGLKPAQNPVEKEGYLSDTVKSQEEAKKNQLMQPGSAPGQPESTMSKIGNVASTVASIASLFSDRRMKHSIRRIGNTDDGMPIYRFKYKGDENERTHIGFMADEVERKHPDAVSTAPNGMKRVDYGQAHKFYQGGLVRPGYAPGGAPETEEEIIRRRLLESDVPRPMNLGDLPNARVTPATGLPAVEAVPTPPRETTPIADLTGLARAAINRSDVRPVEVPQLGLAAARAPVDEVSEFYRTKILKQESNNRQFDENGNPLTSSAGAIGIGQVMPDTGPEAAKMAGLPWDEERFRTDANYNAALGEAYFRNMYDRFGSLDLASAAYNAGPGRLRSAMDRAGAMGGSYLDYLPEETQNYVSSVTGMGSTSRGVAGADEGASAGQDYAGGLGLRAEKPYDERNMLGKMMYDEQGNVKQDALLSLLSGIGTMASSPSLYLGSSILQGIGGAANTYAGLQKQAADIREADSRALETTMRTAKDSIFAVDGVNMVMTPSGLVPFWEFLDNNRLSTGEKLVDDMIRRVGAGAQASGADINTVNLEDTISVPTGPAAIPGNVVWSDASTEALARDAEMMRNQPGQWFETVKQTSAILPAVNAERASAISGKPNVNELAYVVGSAINEGNMGTAGEWYANNVVKPLKTFLPEGWAYPDSAPETQSALLSKLATLSAGDMTPEQQRAASVFQQVAAVYPDLNMPPEAAAAITASVMLSNQESIDRANYYSAYLSQQPTGRGSLVNADAAFAQEYSQLHQMEKSNLQSLLDMADDQTMVGETGKTKGYFVKEFLSDIHGGRMSPEEAQQALTAILGADNVSPGLYRYFIKGM